MISPAVFLDVLSQKHAFFPYPTKCFLFLNLTRPLNVKLNLEILKVAAITGVDSTELLEITWFYNQKLNSNQAALYEGSSMKPMFLKSL